MLADTVLKDPSHLTFKINGNIQGHDLHFLVDSGSTHSFINTKFASLFSGVATLPKPLRVKIADGALMHCDQGLLLSPWICEGHTFHNQFKFLPLGTYDGIIGLDWLSQHSPMRIDWEEQWMSFDYQGVPVTLQGHNPTSFACTIVELSLLHDSGTLSPPLAAEVQQILTEYHVVFSEPVGLPPRRFCDHTIPLIPGAQPIAKKPYRYTPQLKTEIEKQIKEMLDSGVIQISNSAFSSPIILVRKKDNSWRIVVDYRHLNALTVKSKYPVPVIDELLDELAGACWFSKLDLRAGYHQIRMAPGEEFKTAFQTHHG
jgi:hypothetical protein